MIVNWRDPASIAAWYRVHPKRHGPQIAAFARMWPQCAAPIKRAGEMVRAKEAVTA